MRIVLALGIAASLVLATVFLIDGLRPPTTLRLATGIAQGGYWQIGQEYLTELSKDGIEVELVETAGSIENLDLLMSGDVDVAIVQGGLEIPEYSGLQSLGAIFLEPIAVFRHAGSDLNSNAGEWRNTRLAAGPEGSGTRAAVRTLIGAAGLDDAGITLVDVGGHDALKALRTGDADALVFVSPLAAPFLMEAIFDPEIIFVPMTMVDALALKVPGARATTVPAGAITLDPPRPPAPVAILALTASLVARDDLHPGLVDRLVQAAGRIHGNRDILHGFREFPSAESPPVPLNENARQLILSGPTLLHDVFPYWIAAQFGRFMLLILPLLFIVLPVVRALPAAYVWLQKRRIWSQYQSIAALEGRLADATSPDEISRIADDLDKLDQALANLKLPLAYRQGAYDARLHIAHIRQRIMRHGQ